MEEGTVTVDGTSHDLSSPFLVVATQNPFDFEGTYPLPESQLDRFLMRIEMGYPDRSSELEIMRQDGVFGAKVGPQWTSDDLNTCLEAVRGVTVAEEIERGIMDLVRASRSDHRLKRGVSPRGAQALYRACRAYAVVAGRDFVIPDDVWRLAVPVLGHRVVPRADGGPAGIGGRRAIEELLRESPHPG
jgi:MoxR-like ATPase